MGAVFINFENMITFYHNGKGIGANPLRLTPSELVQYLGENHPEYLEELRRVISPAPIDYTSPTNPPDGGPTSTGPA